MKTIERVPEATRAGGEPGAFFYVVNFNEGGYAVVPADGRATDVYALSDEGSFDPDAHNGVRLFMDMAENYLQYEISISDSIRPSGFDLPDGGWTKFPTDLDDPHLYPVVDYNGQQCFRVPKTMETTPFYLLEMEWGQDAPYNLECYTKEGARAKAGCVAVALGQIMAYHKQPKYYNGHTYYWDSMPKKASEYDGSEEARSVAYLISDIGKAVYMDYGVDASGAFDKDCPAALERFGYTYSSYSDYATYKVTESLENNMPVYMRGTDTRRGKGHAWVADGYYEIVSTITYYLVDDLSIVHRDEVSRTTYLHINWGWNGVSNAYYLAYAFKPTTYNIIPQTCK